MDRWSEILQYHVNAGTEADMLDLCRQQELTEPGLWLTALRLLTAPSVTRERDTVVLTTLLDKVGTCNAALKTCFLRVSLVLRTNRLGYWLTSYFNLIYSGPLGP